MSNEVMGVFTTSALCGLVLNGDIGFYRDIPLVILKIKYYLPQILLGGSSCTLPEPHWIHLILIHEPAVVPEQIIVVNQNMIQK